MLRTFRPRACVTCSAEFVPTGPKNRWCSLKCRMMDGIDQTGGPDSCWPWKGLRDDNGYGLVGIKHRSRFAHRITFAAFNNVEIKPSEVVRHRCDNPICCNPRHLDIGSQKDNVEDMVRRGRQQDYSNVLKGQNHKLATITDQQALEIFQANGSLGGIARRFGVTQNIVERIRYGFTWNHVTGLPRRRTYSRSPIGHPSEGLPRHHDGAGTLPKGVLS